MAGVNLYEVLGVGPDAHASEIRRAYLNAARTHHPDFHVDADDATREANARRMQQINEAWEVLGDPDGRRAYDRTLAASSDPGVARRAAREADAGRADPLTMPSGKGWTPRAGDDRWMDDFAGWAGETDRLAPEEPRTPARRLATLAPVLLLAGGIGSWILGVVVDLRELMALGVVLLVFALGLFFLLPMVEMARSRRR